MTGSRGKQRKEAASEKALGQLPGPGFGHSIRNGKISQPTQRAFTPEKWKVALERTTSGDPADERLYRSGLFYHEQLQRAFTLFQALEPIAVAAESHVRLLTATANFIAARDEAGHRSQMRVSAMMSGPGGPSMHAPTIQNAGSLLAARTVQLFDGLRHVLPEAAAKAGERAPDPVDVDAVLPRLGTELDLGRLYDALQTGWQECLWSDYFMQPVEDNGVIVADLMLPADLSREQDRAVADYRRDALLSEFGLQVAAGWMRLPRKVRKAVAEATVVRTVEQDGVLLRPVLGQRGGDLRIPPRTSVNRGLAGEPYLRPLMGEPLPDFGGLTPQQLVDTWELIATLGEVLAERLPDPLAEPIGNIADLEQWAPLVSRAGLEEAVHAALNLTSDEAKRAVGVFVLPMISKSDPWTRPLVPVGADALVPLFNPLANANLIRSIEAWLGEGGLPLARRGTLFEEALREELAGQVELPNAEVIPRSVIVRVDAVEEEIDLIIRIGCTYLVGEVKCSVYPVDPYGYYSYERTLAGAAEQARRKTAFCEHNPESFLAAFGDGCNPDEARILPLVVSNLPLGVGRRIQGVPVVDLFILSRYLDGGQHYSREAVAGPEGIETIEQTSFYDSPEEAEDNLWEYLCNPPQLRDPRAWVTTEVGDMVPLHLVERRLARVVVLVQPPPPPPPAAPAGAGVYGVAPDRKVTPAPAAASPRSTRSGGRNEPCSCGSGKKRKRCCG